MYPSGSHLTRSGVCCAVTCALLVGGGDLNAQTFSATLDVFVGTTDGTPLQGARVVIQGMGIGALTDQHGWARVTELPAGIRSVKAFYLGFAPEEATAELLADRTTTLHLYLTVDPIELAPVTVTARRSILYSRGFYRRKESGQGTFLERDDIAAMRPQLMSDVLRRVSGVMVSRSGITMRGSKNFASCPVQYYIDGTMTGVFNVDNISPEVVEGIEIYRGAATVPIEFNVGRAMCGVIVIWTRMR